jgi:hypothetical protein
LDWIRSKRNILSSLEAGLTQVDIAMASVSCRHQFLISWTIDDILEGHQIKDIIPIIKLTMTRIIAQARMNDGKFYWKGESFILSNSEICFLCNTEDIEDVFYLTLICRIHRSSQTRFCHHLQLQQGINRDDISSKLTSMPTSQLKNLAIYIISALKRRKLFINLANL